MGIHGGSGAHPWSFWHNGWIKEVAMDWNALTDEERLVAEQAVATLRLVKQAGNQAPHGKGLFCLEQAVQDHGFPLLRDILQRSIGAHDEAQKKGRIKDRAD
jgi:hypothetical protein